MTHARSILFALVLVACGGTDTSPATGPEPTPAPTPEPATDPEATNREDAPSPESAALFAEASNQFGTDLFARLDAEGNLVFSPASISVALAMTWGGADGETAAEMARVLHFEGGEADRWHAAAGAQLASWNGENAEGVELAVANRLFGDASYRFADDFLTLTGERYGAPLEAVDFVHAFEPARVHINEWAAEQTRDRIQDLLPEGSIDSMTRLVLTNAVYLDAEWAHAFDASNTTPGPFHAPGGDVQAPMMRQTQTFPYGEVDGAKVLAMPYRGDGYEMVVVLPNANDGIGALQSSLDPDRITAWREAAQPTSVQVAFPKFRLAPPSSLRLTDDLREMGMPLAMSDAADFSGMAEPGTDAPGLRISDVFHKAFIEVDEEGTEAAAATAVVMATRSARPRPTPSFTADHPFLYFIRDTRSGAILFMGRVVDPTAE